MKIQSLVFIIYVFLIFITEWIHSVKAVKFIRSLNTNLCLQRTSTSTSTGCFSVSTVQCPTDRFAQIPDALQWNIIPLNPSGSLNSTNIFIKSNDNNQCLATGTSNTAQVCACDNGSISQQWKMDNQSLINGQQCLGTIGNSVGLSTCNAGSLWESYPVSADSVNIYASTSFTGKEVNLFINNYTSSNLPAEIFSSTYSMEIPPGLQFVIHRSGGNATIYEDDTAQVDPINDLTSTVEIRSKSGIIAYENADYFGKSQFLPTGNISSQNSPMTIGSVIVSPYYRCIIQQSSGNNVALYEPIANFTGVIVLASQVSVTNVDVSAAACSPECTSGGYCTGNNQCTCKPGFTGEQCDKCLPGFWGPNCQVCNDGLSGQCQCAPGFTGANCTTCAAGYFGSDCKPCNCGNGSCGDKGNCTCNTGWTDSGSNKCNVTIPGYYADNNGDVHACPPGCSTCSSPDGACSKCSSGLKQDTDTQACVPITPPTQCDPTCQACYGPNATNCLSCTAPTYLLGGSCVPLGRPSGTCASPGNGAFYVNTTTPGLCEPCPNNCASCTIPNFTPSSPPSNMQCLKCQPGSFLNNGECLDACPPGKFVNPTDNMTCLACDKSCASCTGPNNTQCLSCSDTKKFALNGTCSTTQCPSSFIAINTTCTPCHADCAECSGPSFNQCTKCPSYRPILRGNQCIPACPKGEYADENGSCQACDLECSSCVGPRNDQCLGCNDMSKMPLGGSCTSCPTGSTILLGERFCQKIESDNLVDNTVEKPNNKMPWWAILLIILIAIALIALGIFLVRKYVIKKRKEKTLEFGDKIDNGRVAKNLAELDDVRVSQPEASYRTAPKNALKPNEYDEIGEAPPTYKPEDAENWENFKRKSSKIWKKKKNDWHGFDMVSNVGGRNINRPGEGDYGYF